METKPQKSLQKGSNVLILIGLPGSGKSTICRTQFPEYLRINQDTLGTRDRCLEEMQAALEADKDIIIDRVNFNKKQRSHWVHLALAYGAKNITAIMLDVDPEECIGRICARKDHPTIKEDMPVEQKRKIVYDFYKMMEMPELSEGFSSVVITRN